MLERAAAAAPGCEQEPLARGECGSDAPRMRIASGAFAGSLVGVALALSCAVDLSGARAPSSGETGCASCHADEARTFLRGVRHRGGGEDPSGCETCHEPHAIGAAGERTGAVRTRACEVCHAEVEAQFRLPFRHARGAVRCVECHAPHGGSRSDVREAERREVCVGCHVEFAGAFLYPHEGSHAEGCLSCHEPHGSTNRRMLTHARSRELCLSCHESLEVIHDQAAGSRYRECLDCHTELHGSNWDRLLMR
jgi:DmsE family decaheme c-type cytochrome